MIREVVDLRIKGGRDYLLTLEERASNSASDSLIYEIGPRLPSNCIHASNDCIVRFVQIACSDNLLVADLPRTVISEGESRQLRARGFASLTGRFQPTQKRYGFGQLEELAADMAFVFTELWALSYLKSTIELL